MAWDFSTDPEFQDHLDWLTELMHTEIEPLDHYFRGRSPFDKTDEEVQSHLRRIQQKVKDRGLWACHLKPEMGGMGFGQVQLALMNEILGRSTFGPSAFGSQAPDSGNAEILAHYANDEQKEKYLKPLLAGEISTCYSMTEPQGGSDPNHFTCTAHRDGDEWVINGEKWFASNYPRAEFLIVMLITNPDVSVYRGSSMMLVPHDAPGLELVRNVGVGGERRGHGGHSYLRFNECRVPIENLMGEEGAGFKIAQTRLGGGRVHHAMRSVGTAKKAFDMMCERALSRETKGSLLAEKQAVQHMIADSWVQIEQFRLQVLHAAWQIDQSDTSKARLYIAGVKVATPRVLMDVVFRSMQIHGSLGMSNETPLANMWMMAPTFGVADGPTEVHKDTIAKQVLKDYRPSEGLFPTEHIPAKIEWAQQVMAERIEEELLNA